ncbi:hypothetical protein [Gellertiella hungarica]|uniref:Uncharacterized protein n=1 Tax=Gellertiella hungarica TaxID=1572859 RepID=A0A7W6NM97_9HYPH|nr:hypothetical protein [Gellertiella hungarica]MBB4066250.1 hypothetical protein [Gellertiella hungarica]
MTPQEIKPSTILSQFRSKFRAVVQPGRVLDAIQICDLQRQLNMAYEVTKDFEEEFEILSEIPTPARSDAPQQEGAQVLMFRPKPRLHVIASGPGGGDAA